jgi:hypothetical protein
VCKSTYIYAHLYIYNVYIYTLAHVYIRRKERKGRKEKEGEEGGREGGEKGEVRKEGR